MYKDFLNLKIYDKKIDNNNAVAEIYRVLTSEFETMSQNDLKLNSDFEDIDIAVQTLDEKKAIDKIILYWISYLNYFNRVNYLINIMNLSTDIRKIKSKEISKFIDQAEKHIQGHLKFALSGTRRHCSYLFFKLFEVRNDKNIQIKMQDIYLAAFNSALNYVDSKTSSSGTKLSKKYLLENLIGREFIKHWNDLLALEAKRDF